MHPLNLQRNHPAGRVEVDTKERHAPKDYDCVQFKQLQYWLHSTARELKRM